MTASEPVCKACTGGNAGVCRIGRGECGVILTGGLLRMVRHLSAVIICQTEIGGCAAAAALEQQIADDEQRNAAAAARCRTGTGRMSAAGVTAG